MKELLIIDDDNSTLLIIEKYLSKSGYKTKTASNGKEGLEVLKINSDIDLIVVDVVMPEMGGVEFCRQVRSEDKYKQIPILMLTAMSDITDKYVGFDAGADDYLTKPFEPLELLLRVQALLRRNEINSSGNNKKETADEDEKDIVIDKENFSVKIKGKNIYLTSIEFNLLSYLFNNDSRPVSVEELLQKVMEYPPRTGNPETIRTHIKNIRSKIEEDPSEPKIITTIPKRGYIFKNTVTK